MWFGVLLFMLLLGSIFFNIVFVFDVMLGSWVWVFVDGYGYGWIFLEKLVVVKKVVCIFKGVKMMIEL